MFSNRFACLSFIIIGVFLLFFTFHIKAQHNQLTGTQMKEGWTLLFDGKSSRGWTSAFSDRFPSSGWSVQDGQLMVTASAGGESIQGGDIITTKDYSDFELVLDFKLSEGANSGIKYFVDAGQAKPKQPRSAYGLEYQLLDNQRHPDAKLGKNGNRTLASLYDLIPASAEMMPVSPGTWNTARILSRGGHIEHWLNGRQVLAYERCDSTFRFLVAGSKYREIPGFGCRSKGRILLQEHGSAVAFRNIRIRELRPTQPGSAIYQKESLGMVSYTFRHSFQKDMAATLDTIRAMGIRNMEFSNLFGRKAEDVRQMLEERGMYCTSFGVSYSDATTKTSEVARNARILGAQYVRVATIPYEKSFGWQDAQKAVDDFNRVGGELAENGLIFCYHNHGFEFVPYEGGTLFDYIVRNTNPAFVSFEMDILWTVFPGQDPMKLLERYPDRFRLMHLKDLRKGITGNLSGNTPQENDVSLGTGQMNIPAVLSAAAKTGIRFFYIEDESPNYGVQVPQSILFLHKQSYFQQ